MPFASLNGIRIHSEVHGEGDPVLLINGLCAPSGNWLVQVQGLVLVGGDDNLTVPAFSRALPGMIPGARLKVISGGHGFTIERWEDFDRAVLGFLRGVK